MKDCTSYNVISQYLPQKIRAAMARVGADGAERLSEIRLYSGRAVAFVYPEKIAYLTQNGLTMNFRNTAVVYATAVDISDTVDSLSHYSIHSCAREMKQGFFVIGDGIRVGISGNYSPDGVITEISGLNFRISRNVTGCAEKISSLILCQNANVILCGGVNSGKTTMLRDLCRIVGNRRKVTLIDERNEISSVRGGTPMNDVGTLTNILVGCNRSDGIIAAVRTLSPDYIFCDEISGGSDYDSISDCMACGVNFCATIHAKNFDDLLKNSQSRKIFSSFDYAVFLQGAADVGKISEVRRLDL